MMKKNVIITAICTIAVIFIGNSLTGCVTSRQIDELKAEHRELESKIDDMQTKVDSMETIILNSEEASRKLRTGLSMSNDQLQQQMNQLLENYNQLIDIVQQINANLGSKKIIVGSVPGDTVVQKPPVTQQPPEQPSVDCGNLYDEAFIQFRKVEGDNYDPAIAMFEDFISQCPNHPSVSNAYYWIGEGFYAEEKYVDAITKFEYVLANYKSSPNASRAMYKLGRCNQELGKTKEAKEIYNKVIDEFPESLEASQAKDRLAEIK